MTTNRLIVQFILDTPLGISVCRIARKTISFLTDEYGFSKEEQYEIELCFSEVIQNAIDHGSGGCGSAPVEVECDISDSRIKLIITDRGICRGNIEELKSAFQSKENIIPMSDNERGRGIFLIRLHMDKSLLELLDGGGTRITLIKNKM